MDLTVKKINEITEHLGIYKRGNMGVSEYGTIDGLNIRVSDHLPKIGNLSSYRGTLDIVDDKVRYLFIVVSNDVVQGDDTDNLAEEIEEELKELLEVNDVHCKIEILDIESEDDFKYVDMLVRTFPD